MNDKEFGSKKLLKLKNRRGGPNNSDILQNWFPPEIWSPLFHLYKFQVKLKHSRRDQITHTFCKIGSPQKLGPPSLI